MTFSVIHMAWTVLLRRRDISVYHFCHVSPKECSCTFSRCGGWSPERCRGAQSGLRRAATLLGPASGPVSRTDRPFGRSSPPYRHSYPGAIQHPVAQWLDLGKRISSAGAATDHTNFSPADGQAARQLLAG